MTRPAGQDATSASTFVGRERELGETGVGLSACTAGRGGLFLLSGEPGIGKTRLAEEICRLAGNRGMRTLWGACSEDGGAPAYWPWVPVLRALQQESNGAGDAIARLLDEVVVGGVSATIPAAGPASEERRFLLFDNVTRVLHASAERAPLLIVLDDLHAADLASLHLLAAIVPSLRDRRILIVATYREVDLERRSDAARLLAGAGRHGKGLRLGGLSSAETRRLIQMIHDAPVSDGVVADVYRRTEGNPLFVDEVARWMSLGEAGGRGVAEIPPGVRIVIRERLAPLSSECRRVLAAAAVLGRDFDLGSLCALTGRASSEILVLLREARDAGLITGAASELSGRRFAHVLTRDVLYDDLEPVERARLHAAVGEAIERLQAGLIDSHLAELAHHFGQAAIAGASAKAVDYAVRAGEQAVAQLAYEDAARCFEQALEALALCPGDPFRRGEIELALASARSASGEPRARASFHRAAALARSLLSTDRARAARLLASAAIGVAERGLGLPQTLPDPEVRELLTEALQVGDGDDVFAARLLSLLSMERALDVGDEQCVVLGARAIDIAQRLGDAVVLSGALSAQHFVLWRRHRVDECLEIASRIVDLAQRTGDLRLAVHGRGWRMMDWMTVGEAARFDEDLEHLARAVTPLRQPRYQWIVANYRAMQALWAGRWAEAEDLAMQSLALGERTGDPNATTPPLVQLFLSRRERGQLAGEELKIRFFMERFPESPSPRSLLALTLIDLGRPDEARSEFDRLAAADFTDLQREHRIGVLPWLAEVCAALGDRARAELLYAQIERYAGYNMPVGPASFAGSGFHYLGLLAAALGRVQSSLEHFEAAIRENTRMRGEAWAAWSRHAAARVRLGAAAELGPGAVDEAEALLRQARETAVRLSMLRLQREVDAAFRQVTAAAANAAHEAPAAGNKVVHLRGLRNGRRSAASAVGSSRQPAASESPTLAVFRLEGQYWTIGRPARLLRLKDAKGYAYILRLLQQPNVAVHALDLTAPPTASDATVAREERLGVRNWKEAGDVELDPQARAEYRERLQDLRAELADAEANNDAGRIERLRTEIDFLLRELARAVGLGGRGRPAGHAERARLNVTRAIKAVIRRIAEGDADLGRYLETTIRTGAFCSYVPDPRFQIRWSLG